MSVEVRKAALLALVEDDRKRQCDALHDAAEAQAAALRAQAHARARARVHEALSAARERRDAALAAAEARRQTRERLLRQGRASAALAAAWAALPDELERRWREPAGRGAWLRDAMARAARELDSGGTAWRIRHAEGLPASELEAAVSAAPVRVDCAVDQSLRAGLRIARDGNVLDASLDGLLADRDAVAAAILGRLEDAP